jgi:glutamate--cysteine ligase
MVRALPANTPYAEMSCPDAASCREDDLPISEAEAERLIRAICFKTGPPGTVGAELEWLVRDRSDPSLTVPFSRIHEVLENLSKPGALPGAGFLTLEPGGQVELSTAPAKDLSDCVAAASGDLAVLNEVFGEAGLVLTGHGIDPLRRPSRVLQLPRYAAMEEYFDRDGHWGRLMMCSTASVQVCVDAGLDDDDGTSGFPFRWRLMHALGPVLVGAFANSPLRRGQPTGWKCTRQQVWSRLDPCRTRSPVGAEPTRPGDPSHQAQGDDAREHWVRYAMDAEVLCVRQPDGQPWTVPAGLTFRDWVRADSRPHANGGRRADGGPRASSRTHADRGPHAQTRPHADGLPHTDARPHTDGRPRTEGWPHTEGWPGTDRAPRAPDGRRIPLGAGPTASDLSYHLSTLFPPVRPRGHLELRMIDAQLGDRWVVPVAVVAALADDPAAADAAMTAAEPVWQARRGSAGLSPHSSGVSPWLRAARHGLADPALARAARLCFEAAEAALGRSGVLPSIRTAVADFADQYVQRARCPADDVLDTIGNPKGQS